MFFDDELELRIKDYVTAHFPDAGLVTFDTLKRPPGPRMFVCVYDCELKLIDEIEVQEVMEWVSQDTSEKVAEVQATLLGQETTKEETKTESSTPSQPSPKSGRQRKKKG